jgi:hypothetical protein
MLPACLPYCFFQTYRKTSFEAGKISPMRIKVNRMATGVILSQQVAQPKGDCDMGS